MAGKDRTNPWTPYLHSMFFFTPSIRRSKQNQSSNQSKYNNRLAVKLLTAHALGLNRPISCSPVIIMLTSFDAGNQALMIKTDFPRGVFVIK